MNTPSKRLFVMTMFALLIVPALAQFFGEDQRRSDAEQRFLAQRPHWPGTWAEVKSLPQRLDKYLSDQISLREPMITIYGTINLLSGNSTNSRVIVGSDGWLFLNTSTLLEKMQSGRKDTPAVMHLADHLLSIYRKASAAGIPFMFMVAPNKATIYPEFLPPWLAPSDKASEYDVLADELAGRSVPYIDTRAALLGKKGEGRLLYFATDTHWSSYGSKIAYDGLMRAFMKRYPELPDLSVPTEFIQRGKKPGDLYRMVGLANYSNEEVVELNLPGKKFRRLEKRDGNGLPIALNRASGNAGIKVGLIGDSFTARRFLPYLSQVAKEVLVTHPYGCHFDLQYILDFNPDLIIYQITERRLACHSDADFNEFLAIARKKR